MASWNSWKHGVAASFMVDFFSTSLRWHSRIIMIGSSGASPNISSCFFDDSSSSSADILRSGRLVAINSA
eukprot:5007744-Prymnesium_polylepis.1